MKSITPTELRGNLFKLLDEALRTGIPIEITRGDNKLRIVRAEKTEKPWNLISCPEIIKGDPNDLVHMNREREIDFDLP